MKNKLFTIVTITMAVFMLCSCNPENNTENADPSATVNWHDAPFKECNEKGEILWMDSQGYHGVEYPSSLNWFTPKYKNNESEFEDDDWAAMSTSLDGSFYYVLVCRKGIGWCLDTYKKAEDGFTGKKYEYNGVEYNLDEPLSSYQLTFQNPKTTPCFAYKAENGRVYTGRALRILKTKNLVKDSLLGEEMTALEGYWYIIARDDLDIMEMPTQVFTYRGKDGDAYWPQYIYDQLINGTDTYDSSTEGWNKNTISAIVGYFNNGWKGGLLYGTFKDYILSPSFLED